MTQCDCYPDCEYAREVVCDITCEDCGALVDVFSAEWCGDCWICDECLGESEE